MRTTKVVKKRDVCVPKKESEWNDQTASTIQGQIRGTDKSFLRKGEAYIFNIVWQNFSRIFNKWVYRFTDRDTTSLAHRFICHVYVKDLTPLCLVCGELKSKLPFSVKEKYESKYFIFYRPENRMIATKSSEIPRVGTWWIGYDWC